MGQRYATGKNRGIYQMGTRSGYAAGSQKLKRCGGIAQLGERSVRIREVEGSNPFVSTILESRKVLIIRGFRLFCFFCKPMRNC